MMRLKEIFSEICLSSRVCRIGVFRVMKAMKAMDTGTSTTSSRCAAKAPLSRCRPSVQQGKNHIACSPLLLAGNEHERGPVAMLGRPTQPGARSRSPPLLSTRVTAAWLSRRPSTMDTSRLCRASLCSPLFRPWLLPRLRLLLCPFSHGSRRCSREGRARGSLIAPRILMAVGRRSTQQGQRPTLYLSFGVMWPTGIWMRVVSSSEQWGWS
mmetsp:Transcript_8311/g.20303  ORF Transcript_8311/g.20303 Transcript_8311/m.20303 type:complete len:211 (-) Transcript_8311:531-1163(-)